MFEAYYVKGKVLKLAMLGFAFAGGGVWMAMLPDGAFDGSRRIVGLATLLGLGEDAVGHGVGWAAALLGMAVLPILARQLAADGPAIRIDAHGIYWRRWSPVPIPWSNIDRIGTSIIHRNAMVSLTLRNPALNRSTGPLARMAGLNAAMGWGHVALTAQGTDRSFDELHEAVLRHADLHGRTPPRAARAPSPAQRGFDRRD